MSQDRPLAPRAQLQSRTACLIGAKASRRRRSARSKPAMRNIVKIISGAASAAWRRRPCRRRSRPPTASDAVAGHCTERHKIPVIPGRRAAASPEPIKHRPRPHPSLPRMRGRVREGEYGFRARSLRPRPGMTGLSVQRCVAKARKRRKQCRPPFADLAQIRGSAYLDARRSVWGPNRRDPPYDVRRPLTNWSSC